MMKIEITFTSVNGEVIEKVYQGVKRARTFAYKAIGTKVPEIIGEHVVASDRGQLSVYGFQLLSLFEDITTTYNPAALNLQDVVAKKGVTGTMRTEQILNDKHTDHVSMKEIAGKLDVSTARAGFLVFKAEHQAALAVIAEAGLEGKLREMFINFEVDDHPTVDLTLGFYKPVKEPKEPKE